MLRKVTSRVTQGTACGSRGNSASYSRIYAWFSRNRTHYPRNRTHYPRNRTHYPRNHVCYPRNHARYPRNRTSYPRNHTWFSKYPHMSPAETRVEILEYGESDTCQIQAASSIRRKMNHPCSDDMMTTVSLGHELNRPFQPRDIGVPCPFLEKLFPRRVGEALRQSRIFNDPQACLGKVRRQIRKQ